MLLPLFTELRRRAGATASICIALSISASPAVGDPVGPSVISPTVEQSPEATAAEIARAYDEADRLIAEAGASEWFENITDSVLPRVRHRPSGMVCRFSDPRHDAIIIYDNHLPRGDDVSCDSYIAELGIDVRLYATRFGSEASPQWALEGADLAIQTRYPGAVRYEGDVAVASREGGPHPIASAWRLPMGDGESLSMVLIAHNAEWSFKARVSGPIEDPMMVSLVAGAQFLLGLEGVGGWPAEPAED